MSLEYIDVNKIGSWYINNNKKIREDLTKNKYKRLMTIMAYSQIESLERFNSHLYENRLRRDGIVVSIANFLPDGRINYRTIPDRYLSLLESVNNKYGFLSDSEIDKVHLDLLEMFHNPGGLKESI